MDIVQFGHDPFKKARTLKENDTFELANMTKELYFDLLVTLCLSNLTFKTVSNLCVKHCITST